MYCAHDFSDRLSPFLVKELRAGLRTRGYMTVSLVFTAALTLFTVVTIDDPKVAEFSEPIVKGALSTTLGLVMPLASMDALFAERRGKKLEPLILSPVTARGVVHGKWLIAALQSALLASIATPFIVLRYFSGGADIVNELAFMVLALGTGFIGVAFMICASGLMRENNTLVNTLVRVVATFMMLYGGGIAVAITTAAGVMMRTELWNIAPFVLIGCLFGAFVLLEIAALTLGANFGSPMRTRIINYNTPPALPA